jgi:hypothetical protein
VENPFEAKEQVARKVQSKLTLSKQALPGLLFAGSGIALGGVVALAFGLWGWSLFIPEPVLVIAGVVLVSSCLGLPLWAFWLLTANQKAIKPDLGDRVAIKERILRLTSLTGLMIGWGAFSLALVGLGIPSDWLLDRQLYLFDLANLSLVAIAVFALLLFATAVAGWSHKKWINWNLSFLIALLFGAVLLLLAHSFSVWLGF